MNVSRVLLAVGGSAAIALVAWAGAGSIGTEVWRAWWAVPAAIAIHAGQLGLSAHAWRSLAEQGPPAATWWRIRWVREAVNSLLPVAQLGGNVVGVRLLARRGTPLVHASAVTVLDITAEAISQALFTLMGLAALAASVTDRGRLGWFAGFAALLLAGVAGFVVAQRLGLLQLLEGLAARAGFPDLVGLHAETTRLARPRALARATALHLAAWTLGTAETAVALAAMGQPAHLTAALAIESLGMAARSAGFVVPGALGVQESGFVLVGSLFGIPAETAIALSMIKRARELIVGTVGLLAWQYGGRETSGDLARFG